MQLKKESHLQETTKKFYAWNKLRPLLKFGEYLSMPYLDGKEHQFFGNKKSNKPVVCLPNVRWLSREAACVLDITNQKEAHMFVDCRNKKI